MEKLGSKKFSEMTFIHNEKLYVYLCLTKAQHANYSLHYISILKSATSKQCRILSVPKEFLNQEKLYLGILSLKLLASNIAIVKMRSQNIFYVER